MANETKWTYASQVTLEASGASSANAAFTAADDTGLASANHSNYPYADFVLKTVGFGASLSTGDKYIALYRGEQNIDGTAGDALAPATSNRACYVGSFFVAGGQASTATSYYALTDVPLVADQLYWIENQTGQTVSAGWTLKATPKAIVPG